MSIKDCNKCINCICDNCYLRIIGKCIPCVDCDKVKDIICNDKIPYNDLGGGGNNGGEKN